MPGLIDLLVNNAWAMPAKHVAQPVRLHFLLPWSIWLGNLGWGRQGLELLCKRNLVWACAISIASVRASLHLSAISISLKTAQ